MRVSDDRNYPRNMNNSKTGQNKGKTKNKLIHWSTDSSQLWSTRSPAVLWAECCCWTSEQGEGAQFFGPAELRRQIRVWGKWWLQFMRQRTREVTASWMTLDRPAQGSPWETGSSLTFLYAEWSSPGKVKFQVKESTGHSKARSPQGPCTARNHWHASRPWGATQRPQKASPLGRRSSPLYKASYCRIALRTS